MKCLLIIFLIKSLCSLSHKTNKIIHGVINSIQTPVSSLVFHTFSYTGFSVHIKNIRHFKPITKGLVISSIDNKIKSDNITMTIACDIILDLGRNYTYNDFLMQYKLMFIINEDKTSYQYKLDDVVVDKLFMSPFNDIIASKSFKPFAQDHLNILGLMKDILVMTFNDHFAHFNWFYYDLVAILDSLQKTITYYALSIPHEGNAIKEVTAIDHWIEKIAAPDESIPGVLLSRYARFNMEFTIVDVNSGETHKINDLWFMKCIKRPNQPFDIVNISWKVLSLETGKEFQVLLSKEFNEIARKYEENN